MQSDSTNNQTNEDLSKDEIIESYYQRDINMNLSIENVFNYIINKLKLNPENYEDYIREEYNLFIENNELYGYSHQFDNQELDDYLEDRLQSNYYQEKQELYDRLSQLHEDNNHIGLYDLLSIGQLIYLGW